MTISLSTSADLLPFLNQCLWLALYLQQGEKVRITKGWCCSPLCLLFFFRLAEMISASAYFKVPMTGQVSRKPFLLLCPIGHPMEGLLFSLCLTCTRVLLKEVFFLTLRRLCCYILNGELRWFCTLCCSFSLNPLKVISRNQPIAAVTQ